MRSLFKTAAARQDARVIGLVGFAHGTSHFFHLLLPPLFPWLMRDFGLSFTEVGALMTIFFVISGVGQAVAGFAVDRFGPSRVLMCGVASLAAVRICARCRRKLCALLAVSAALAGLGNSVFPSGGLHYSQPARVAASGSLTRSPCTVCRAISVGQPRRCSWRELRACGAGMRRASPPGSLPLSCSRLLIWQRDLL